MLTAPDLNTSSDAMRFDAPPSMALAPQRLPLNERPAWALALRPVPPPRPVVEDDDFDSMWLDGLNSW